MGSMTWAALSPFPGAAVSAPPPCDGGGALRLRLDVFGSALREDFRSGESDVDLLVEFGPMDGYAKSGSLLRPP
jgi:hypothetical protein